MKLITATMYITRDMLVSTSFDIQEFVKREVLHRLKARYEETVGHSVSNALWEILAPAVVELTTVLFEADVWQIKAQMMIPDQFELFKESNDV